MTQAQHNEHGIGKNTILQEKKLIFFSVLGDSTIEIQWAANYPTLLIEFHDHLNELRLYQDILLEKKRYLLNVNSWLAVP